MLPLPLGGPGVVREACLGFAKAPSVKAAPASHGWNLKNLVEHLVKDNPLNEVARHKRAVEGAVDADEPLLNRIGTHPERSVTPRPASPGGAPRNGRLDGTTKETSVQVIEDGLKVMHSTPRLEGAPATASLGTASDVLLVLLNELPKHA